MVPAQHSPIIVRGAFGRGHSRLEARCEHAGWTVVLRCEDHPHPPEAAAWAAVGWLAEHDDVDLGAAIERETDADAGELAGILLAAVGDWLLHHPTGCAWLELAPADDARPAPAGLVLGLDELRQQIDEASR